MKNRCWYIKLSAWEYWPTWILYVPVFIQHLFLSVKARNLFYFLNVNPAINDGFILSDSKYKTLQLVPDEFRPKMAFIAKQSSIAEVQRILDQHQLTFPVIIKPEIGYRGLLVHLCKEAKDLQAIDFKKGNYIVQEYIDYTLEIGIFYYRFPDAPKGCIPSITLKEFLSITGDGKHTFNQLIAQKPRARLHYERLKLKFHHHWNEVLPKGTQFVLESIGNHNRGTKFINANDLLDNDLLAVFDELNKKMNGFCYGRFDVRVKSLSDLKQGKNFKILEVNGIGAEPTHIYDPSYKLVQAWKDLLFLWKVAYRIALINRLKGEKFPVFTEGKQRYLQYMKYKKKAFAS